ncbi:MAG: nucleotidyltransferase domain-containing protein [Egibacteraceae bacterium]
MGAEAVLRRRRAERAALIARGQTFAQGLSAELQVRAVVLHGSVARGDFNVWSDVDVLVVADALPERFLDRLDALAPWPPRIQPVAWTPAEWRQRSARRDPIAVTVCRHGVWLAGAPEDLAEDAPTPEEKSQPPRQTSSPSEGR